MRINSNISLFSLFLSTIFLTGCLKKEQYKELDQGGKKKKQSSNYFTVNSPKECTAEEILASGLHILPYAEKTRCVKNSNFYIVDAIFEMPAHSKDKLFSVLNNLYVNDGWMFLEETNELEYFAASCRKVGKEIYIFIEEKEEYQHREKKYKKYLFLHQSLFLDSP